MKILFINNFLSNYGGAESFMLREASLLKEKGHEVFFFSSDKQPYFIDNYEYAEYFPKHVDYRALSGIQTFRYFFRPFYNFESRDKLNYFIKKIKPDLVHCHNIYYHLSPSILEACFKNNVPVLMTLHDIRLMCPSGTLMQKDKYYCNEQLCLKGNPFHCLGNKCKDKSIKSSFIATTEYIFNRVHGLYNGISYFICPSQAIAKLALNAGINEKRLTHLNIFVSNSFFENIPKYSNDGYFLYLGRLAKEKGIHYLLEAMSRLPDIKLHIVGRGPEENNLKEQAKKLGLSNVEFFGFLPDQDIIKQYENCIASILTSNWFENSPATIIESFTYGKPVIASNIGGIPELIEDKKQGIIFEPGNVDELIRAIKRLHSDNELAIEMGKDARLKAELLYNPQVHYDKLVKIYTSII